MFNRYLMAFTFFVLLIISLILVLTNITHAMEFSENILLTRSNTVFLDQEISFSTADSFIAAALAKRLVLPKNEPLYLVLDTNGGDVEAAREIEKVMQYIPNVAWICKNCMSSGAYLMAGGKVRLATQKSYAMMHEIYFSHVTLHDFERGTLQEKLKISSPTFDKVIYTTLHMTKSEYEAKIDDKEWELNGEELVRYKLAQRLVNIQCDNNVSKISPSLCGIK